MTLELTRKIVDRMGSIAHEWREELAQEKSAFLFASTRSGQPLVNSPRVREINDGQGDQIILSTLSGCVAGEPLELEKRFPLPQSPLVFSAENVFGEKFETAIKRI